MGRPPTSRGTATTRTGVDFEFRGHLSRDPQVAIEDLREYQEAVERWGYAHLLRADRAEAELRQAERKLARLLQMADAWEKMSGDLNVSVAADAVRLAIRPQ